MKRLFIGSTLLLAATIFLTGCVSHAPVKSVHIIKVHSNQYLPNHTKKHNYTSHQTVKVYQTHYPKVVRYEPQHSSHHIYQQSLYKQHKGYVKTHKSIKKYSKDNKQRHAYSKKKVVTNKKIVTVVKKSRPIVVNKPKNQVHQSRNTDIRNQKYHKDNGKKSNTEEPRSEQKSERRSGDTSKVKKVRTIQTERTYSRR